MRQKTAITTNIAALQAMYEELNGRPAGVPALGLVFSDPGYGKTMATAWLSNRINGICVTLTSGCTANDMLRMIVRELGGDPRFKRMDNYEFIVEEMAITGRPLFIDEADFMFDKSGVGKDCLETLRGIHDITGCPIILIGMGQITTKLQRLPQFFDRISSWVQFMPASMEDVDILINALVEDVIIEDDLKQHLLEETGGVIRTITIGLAKIEEFARGNSLTSVNASQWADRPYKVAPSIRRAMR